MIGSRDAEAISTFSAPKLPDFIMKDEATWNKITLLFREELGKEISVKGRCLDFSKKLFVILTATYQGKLDESGRIFLTINGKQAELCHRYHPKICGMAEHHFLELHFSSDDIWVIDPSWKQFVYIDTIVYPPNGGAFFHTVDPKNPHNQEVNAFPDIMIARRDEMRKCVSVIAKSSEDSRVNNWSDTEDKTTDFIKLLSTSATDKHKKWFDGEMLKEKGVVQWSESFIYYCEMTSAWENFAEVSGNKTTSFFDFAQQFRAKTESHEGDHKESSFYKIEISKLDPDVKHESFTPISPSVCRATPSPSLFKIIRTFRDNHIHMLFKEVNLISAANIKSVSDKCKGSNARLRKLN